MNMVKKIGCLREYVQNGDDVADGNQTKWSVALICDVDSVDFVSLQGKNSLAQSSGGRSVQWGTRASLMTEDISFTYSLSRSYATYRVRALSQKHQDRAVEVMEWGGWHALTGTRYNRTKIIDISELLTLKSLALKLPRKWNSLSTKAKPLILFLYKISRASTKGLSILT